MPVLESIGVAALGWVASPVVAKLLNKAFASLGIDAEKKLRKLRVTVLPLLESVIEKAEGSEYCSEVEDWLQRLKDAYDGVQDALDLLNNRRLKRKAAAAAAASSSKRQTNGVRTPFRVPKHLKWAIPVLKGGRDMLSPYKIKLKLRLNKFEKIANEAETFRNLLDAKSDQTVSPYRQTISLPLRKVFGRNEDHEEIIRRLKKEPAAGIPIIAIVGRPGVGKTTLAKYVCQQLRSESGNKHFDPIMWVDASRNFNASEIMKEIVQQASIASEPQDPVNPDDLPGMVRTHPRNLVANLGWPEELRLEMNKMLKAKKFLLVIDYVWCDGEDHRKEWETLSGCLGKCRLPGSKILVTSQANDARRLEGEMARLTAATEVKEGEIAALERMVGALKEAEDDLRKRHSLLVEKIREKDDALMKLGERNSSLEEEIIKLKDALVVFDERNAVLEGEKKNTAAVLRAVSAGAAAAAAVTAVYLRRRR